MVANNGEQVSTIFLVNTLNTPCLQAFVSRMPLRYAGRSYPSYGACHYSLAEPLRIAGRQASSAQGCIAGPITERLSRANIVCGFLAVNGPIVLRNKCFLGSKNLHKSDGSLSLLGPRKKDKSARYSLSLSGFLSIRQGSAGMGSDCIKLWNQVIEPTL